MSLMVATALAEFDAFPLARRPNPKARSDTPYGARQRAVLGRAQFEQAKREIGSWPGYAPTPLVGLPGLARAIGIGSLSYKDESGRFGLGSFKALGGAYAVLRQLQARLGDVSSVELRAGKHRARTGSITVTCATDGNHGRSVAWGAQLLGCRCVIYIHETVSQGRADAIARFGAEVRRVPGTYDDAVRQAARDAAVNGWIVVSDTSYPGYTDIPRDVMQGYTVMADEALAQMPEPPTHVFIQAGVGGLAAAVCGHLWETLGERRPRVVVVEPDRAACLFESAAQGRAANIHGALDTMMAGLACGETSILAWEILEGGASDFLTVTDEAAAACMRLLATGGGDPRVVAGESAVAGLAGLLCAAARPTLARALGLDTGSRVLLFGSEGDTDPALYEKIVGQKAAVVHPR